MRRNLVLALLAFTSYAALAQHTLPLQGNIVKPTDPHIQYVGRISFQNPERPAWNYPGVQINAAFEGTSAKLVCKPGSGYFMAQIDEAEPFKVAFRGERDSVVTIATALPHRRHTVRLMYCIEGYEMRPEFWGFVFDGPVCDAPALPSKTIEFIGNSITCAYGNEATHEGEHFQYETENHYNGYAQMTARALGAQAYVVARSGIGVYRHYDGPKTGTPSSSMATQYDYTIYATDASLRQPGTLEAERWDFDRFQPQVVCINLGTNDLSTHNYDVKLFRQAYEKLLHQVRSHNPKAKIVLLTGSMLNGKELDIARKNLDEIAENAKRDGDREVYRFDFTPADGQLKYGADWHPSLWQHQKMAAELTAYLRALMQWF